MPDTLITTLLILLSEIVLILIIIGVWILLRRRLRKQSLVAEDHSEQHQNLSTTRPSPDPAILDYLSSAITMTEDLLAGLSPDQVTEQNRLGKRLMALQAEKDLLQTATHDARQVAFWDTLNRYYDSDGGPQQDHGHGAGNEAVYMARIRSLENFRTMFLDSQQQLKNSFNVINELKSTLGQLPDADENRQLEDMVNELSLDNINMNKKLVQAQQHIQALLDELNDTQVSSDAAVSATATQNDRIQMLEEENKFLCSQIQHLLQQEIENNQAMEKKMAELETALKQATSGDTGIA